MRIRRPLIAGLAAVTAATTAAVALAAPSSPITIKDAKGDVASGPDLQRVGLSRGSDGRLRATITFTGSVSASSLRSESGPPGSICLRLWTAEDADPTAERANRLVCVTAKSDDELRATVLQVPDSNGLPKPTGTASVQRNKSGRSIVIRVSQTAIGRPSRIRFAAEATRPGCPTTSCVDTAPNAPATRTFRLK